MNKSDIKYQSESKVTSFMTLSIHVGFLIYIYKKIPPVSFPFNSCSLEFLSRVKANIAKFIFPIL